MSSQPPRPDSPSESDPSSENAPTRLPDGRYLCFCPICRGNPVPHRTYYHHGRIGRPIRYQRDPSLIQNVPSYVMPSSPRIPSSPILPVTTIGLEISTETAVVHAPAILREESTFNLNLDDSLGNDDSNTAPQEFENVDQGDDIDGSGASTPTSYAYESPHYSVASTPPLELEEAEGVEISRPAALAVEFLRHKIEFNETNASSDALRHMSQRLFNEEIGSTYVAKRTLNSLIPMEMTLIPCCIDSCMAFESTDPDIQCAICGSTKKQSFAYYPLAPRLQIQFANEERVTELLYRERFLSQQQNTHEVFRDVFNGQIYRDLADSRALGRFDIILSGSLDGHVLHVNAKKDTQHWPVILINHNLDPKIRWKKENLLISISIPGPNQPKDIDSFLRPLRHELQLLQGKYNMSSFKNYDLDYV